ncbi:hypothetical protein AGR7C_Cc230030 [Agrobacterium deltaense Zutra 3/1]|uniref:Uncharacterized protein n=1 Tax=Agrobacterium deltaense Zutra 3/1 TaxID=1183427 RepID=A0A1S7PZP4_9HYPH|nr:hypothetical protein AGR7C_Cc230030 [Agrobacterium deltaense Zutra 3/1]
MKIQGEFNPILEDHRLACGITDPG